MNDVKTTAIDPMTLEPRTGTGYPDPYKEGVRGRERRALGDVFGITNFGVNLTRLPPGCASALRHWHHLEDEFVYIVEGTPTLITDEGEQVLKPGMVAGFPAGRPNGHHLVNRSDADVLYLEVGDRKRGEIAEYPDVDLLFREVDGVEGFFHKDGTPY